MKKHFDFIEIGTSDFDTLIENSNDETVGLSIEPIGYYLDKLPNKKNVKKLQSAISDNDGTIEIYYIPDEKIIEHKLKWWVRGSNSIGGPHPFALKELGSEFYNSIVKIDKVPTLSWKTLVEQENIGSIDYLKIDTEGFDHVILKDYLALCESNPTLFAKKIKFERHPEVSKISEIDKLIPKFKDYFVEFNETDVILTKVKIPRIIHQTFRTNELPEPIQVVVDKLKLMNPEFEYRFYNDEDCYNFIKENYDEETLDLYANINPKYGSCKADFFRYLLMYKVGGVYLDIKSTSTQPLAKTILPTDEYILSHWKGRDWANELNYVHGEFQNWHIICIPGHPFLKDTIERVKNNLRNYKGGVGKKTVLHLTGPVPYSKSILVHLNKLKTNYTNSPVREFKVEDEINLSYRGTLLHQDKLYGFNISNVEPIMLKEFKPKTTSNGLFYKGKKIADRGCVINLPERKDRRVDIEKTLTELNFSGFEFVDGVVMEDEEYKKLGCTQAYMNIFQEFLDSDMQNILIFEDDLKLMDGVTEKQLDKIFDNWDESVERYDVLALGIKLLPRSKVYPNSETDGSFKEMLCSQSLFYKRNFVEHYVDQMKNYLDPNHYLYKCTIDMFLNDSTNSEFRFRHGAGHKVFDFGITIPMIFTQTSSYSDNEKEIQNYDTIMKDVFWKSLVYQRGYVYLANEKYFDIVQTSARSVREFSKYPIFVYMLNSDKKVDVENTTTIRWDVDLPKSSGPMYNSDGENFYIDRSNSTIYNILIQRINAVKHALENFVQTAVYIDSDSIATPYIDSIFDMYNKETPYPYFVEGIYDWMHHEGRGGAETRDDLSTTLEAPACELFNIDQYVRQKYRQTGYFVAGQKSIGFLEEWYWYCTHPKVLKNSSWYAAYNEETIMNVLTYKHKIFDGLPYIYVNGGSDIVDRIYTEVEFLGEGVRNDLEEWLRVPETKEKVLFFHGEKRINKMEEMIEKIKGYFEYDIKPPKNWGDIISHKVIQHFSGQKIYSSDVFHFDSDARVPFLEGKLLAAGSILMYSLPTDYVWGSGCIKENEVGLPPKKYYAVRGPLTRNELLKVNRECPEVYGDPGLLFPRIYNPDIEKKYKYGVIPHYIDFKHPETLKCIKKLKEMGVKIINITAGLYEFVDQLKEVEFVISSSLHGLIAADAYGIPNSRIYFSNNINGGDFKYMDYYYSVNRHYETPRTITYENAEQLINELVFDLGDTSIADKLLESAPWNDPSCILFNSNKKMRLLFVAPHLSTGGMPGFLLKKIQLLKQYYPEIKIFVVEYQSYGDAYVVQRNQIIDIVDRGNFWTLGPDKSELIRIIKNNEIDIVHVQEMIEGFDSFNQMPPEIMSQLYSNDRTWKMVETCHNVWFNHEEHKIFYPEAFAFCTPYHKDVTFKNVPSYSENIEFPIEKKIFTEEERIAARKELGFGKDKIHVINVGLWTKGKNQGEGVEIARLLKKTNPEIVFHFIGNQASNFKDYWGPIMKNLPMNVKVWGERADVDTFMKAADVFMFNSTWECNPLVLREAISYGLKVLCRNLPQYMDMFTPYVEPIDDNIETTKEKLLSLINEDVKYKTPEGQEKEFASKYSDFYKKVLDLPVKEQYFKTKLSVTQYFINQPFIEIKGKSENKFKVQFFDEKGVLHYENLLSINSWVKLNRQYFTRWTTKVWENDNLVYENTLNYGGKRVYIAFDSKSLGDNISWIPYAEEFRKLHNCEVVVSTFWNHLFESVYPNLKFVHPGTTVNNIHGMYKLGWFYNVDMQPTKPNLIPLQQTATDILGLKFKEIQPKIHYEIKERPYAEKYVTIATNSTAGCKFWTKEGWQETINYLTSLGYKVVNVSKENNPFENQIRITDTSMENTMNVIHHSEFFIGLSSGLSWLAWGMGKHVVMISNFTTPDHEFQSNCTRIINLSVCNGCWNKPEFTFDKGDWNWCPVHKGTERHFECHKSITSDMLIKQIQHLLK